MVGGSHGQYLGPRRPSGPAFFALSHGGSARQQSRSSGAATGPHHGNPLPHQPREPRCPGWEARQRPEPPSPGEEEQASTPQEETATAAAESVSTPRRLWSLRPVRVPQLWLRWRRQPLGVRGARLQPLTRPCPGVGAARSTDLPRLRSELLRLPQGAGEPLPPAGVAGAAATSEALAEPAPTAAPPLLPGSLLFCSVCPPRLPALASPVPTPGPSG